MLICGVPGKDRLFVDRTTLNRLIEVFGPGARVLDVMTVLRMIEVRNEGGRVH